MQRRQLISIALTLCYAKLAHGSFEAKNCIGHLKCNEFLEQARAEENKRNFENARRNYEDAYKQLADTSLLLNVGRMCIQLGEYEKAAEYLKLVIADADRDGDNQLKARATDLKGMVDSFQNALTKQRSRSVTQTKGLKPSWKATPIIPSTESEQLIELSADTSQGQSQTVSIALQSPTAQVSAPHSPKVAWAVTGVVFSVGTVLAIWSLVYWLDKPYGYDILSDTDERNRN